jgi:enoyl-CoA hydratase/carnithine racemase
VSYSIDTRWYDSIADAIAVVTFSDPARNNQVCWAAVDELGETLRDCRESGARVVILASGLDGHWLQHAWLQDLLDGVQGKEQTGTGLGWFGVQEELAHESVVSIAAISGDASGGGAELGWACDIRIAERQARFSQPEVDMGLTTGIGGCSRLARLAGRATATDMVLTGRPLSAQRLYDLGAISRLVAAGEALAGALELARSLVCRSPAALAGLKRILADASDLPLTEALQHEQAVFQSVVVTGEALTGMQRVQSGYDRESS